MDGQNCCHNSTSKHYRNTMHLLLILLSLTISTHLTQGRIYNNPEYDWEYLDDDCQPYNETDDSNAKNWFGRVKNLTDGTSRLYGFVQPERDNVYRGPLNCAIKVVAPPNYRLVVRVPRVEIHHDDTGCDVDYMSIIGASNHLKYCGFGTVTNPIYSSENWLIFRMLASPWEGVNHDYIGFQLYYTAVHYGACDVSGDNATEWRCSNMAWCTPSPLVCDSKDNCGSWEEEKASVCGLTQGAIVAISVVSVLVGGTAIFFIGYCIYKQQKQKKARDRRHTTVVPTMTRGHGANGNGHIIMSPIPPNHQGAMTEPPPPYTPLAFINLGYGDMPTGQVPNDYDTIPDISGDNAISSEAHNNNTENVGTPDVTSNNINIRFATAASLRPTMGEPPPAYEAEIGGPVTSPTGGVGFGTLPDKSNT